MAALRKWAGWIGFQPVIVRSDHRSLEHWVTEQVDTPSGPRGRRARWHETISQFNLSVEYLPGKDNLVADALSRFAYPASSSREDVSFHGSAAAHAEVTKLLEEEFKEARLVSVIRLGKPNHFRGIPMYGIPGLCVVAGEIDPKLPISKKISVTTRNKVYVTPPEEASQEPEVREEQEDPHAQRTPPPRWVKRRTTRSRRPAKPRTTSPTSPQEDTTQGKTLIQSKGD